MGILRSLEVNGEPMSPQLTHSNFLMEKMEDEEGNLAHSQRHQKNLWLAKCR